MHETATAPGIPQPPLLVTAAGTPRCVGVEIEFTRLSALQAAEALFGALGGSLRIEDPHDLRICNSQLGDLRVETDLRFVHPQRYHNLSLRLGQRAAAWLGTLVAPVVPRELVTAPLPFVRLREVDDAVAALRSAGASRHGALWLDSLSAHFNSRPLLASQDGCLCAVRQRLNYATSTRARGLSRDRPGCLGRCRVPDR
jgi:hypothetical protein